MIILPAIDIKDGKCVRLKQGDYETAHQVAEDILQTAQRFQDEGATWLHMVDLDGAKAGKPVNADSVLSVVKTCNLKIEIGGGIRSFDSIDLYLNNGVSRVILGSIAITNPEFVQEAVKRYGDKIAVGIDARDGSAAADGWTQTSSVNYLDLALQMQKLAVKYIIFTDISRDGMLNGPNLDMLQTLSKTVSCNIIASGGITNLEDIRKLAALQLYGAICGKALYTNDLNLCKAIDLCRETE